MDGDVEGCKWMTHKQHVHEAAKPHQTCNSQMNEQCMHAVRQPEELVEERHGSRMQRLHTNGRSPYPLHHLLARSTPFHPRMSNVQPRSRTHSS